MPHDAPERVAAGMSYVLELAGHEGHVYLPFDVFVTRAARLLGVDACFAETVLLQRLREEDGLVDEVVAPAGADQQAEHAVYRTWSHRAEVGLGQPPGVAGAGRWRPAGDLPQPRLAAAAPRATEGTPASPSPSVRRPRWRPPSRAPTVLTGDPGTGKTVTLSAAIRLADASGVEVALACPTGRAAERLSEATGQLAQTVHRLLEVKPQDGLLSFTRNEAYPLDADLVIVDEASMLDLLLAYSLVRAIRPGAHLVLVGDVDQLPSVGAGNVLRDVIVADPAGLPNAALIRLDTIFRQAAGSYIIDNAHRVVRGQLPVTDDPDATDFFLARTTRPGAAELIEQLVCERIPAGVSVSVQTTSRCSARCTAGRPAWRP